MVKLSNLRSINHKVMLDAAVSNTHGAFQTKTGRIRAVENIELWRADLHRDRGTPDRGIEALGIETIFGKASIEIDMDWLNRMVMAAARSAGRRAQCGRGGVVVKFWGQRTFKAEEVAQ